MTEKNKDYGQNMYGMNKNQMAQSQHINQINTNLQRNQAERIKRIPTSNGNYYNIFLDKSLGKGTFAEVYKG